MPSAWSNQASRDYRLIAVPERILVGSRRLWWCAGLAGVLVVVVVGAWLYTPPAGSRAFRVPREDPNLLERGLNEEYGGDGAGNLWSHINQGLTNVHLPFFPTSTSTVTTTSTTLTTTTVTTTTLTTTSTVTRTSTTKTTTTNTTTSMTTTSTTTTSTTLCRTAVVGDPCHSRVMLAMQTPEKYGLTRDSTFEEFQDSVSKDPTSQCHLPCPCSVVQKGSDCYKSVQWAMETGISQHPEWYTGLTVKSRFDEVLAHVHQYDQKSNCPSRACAASLEPAMTFFCFSIIRSEGYELDIVKNQFAWDAGIFACDGYAVLCDKKLVLGGSATGPVETVLFNTAEVGVSKDGTAANAQLFMNAWSTIKTSTDYSKYDWTLKVDPDAVLIPDRLRPHLVPFTNQAVYVRQCNKWPGLGWPMMFGSTEIYSRQAVHAYFEGEQRCKNVFPWQPWGEDYFMNQCLDYLKVGTSDDYGVAGDELCKGVDCGDAWAASFHPFKSTVEWMQCWRKATGTSTLHPPPKPVFQPEIKPKSESETDADDQMSETDTDDQNDQKEAEPKPEHESEAADQTKRKMLWVKKLKK